VHVEADNAMASPTEDTQPAGWISATLDRDERALVAYVRRLLGDLETARDVVQEAFLRLCRTDRPPPPDRARPWLYRVCRNLAIDHLRKEGRMHLLEQTGGLTDPATVNGSAGRHSAERSAERAEETNRLFAFVQDLPARQQEVLRLRFQDALSYREIASVTGASISHVGVLLHGAMAALRRRMAPPQSAACERSQS